MVSQTNEQALETTIEQALTGMTTEEMKAAGDVRQTPADDLVANSGFCLGLPMGFNAQYAIDEKLFWRFLEQTQSTQLAKLQKHNPADWQSQAAGKLRPAGEEARHHASAEKEPFSRNECVNHHWFRTLDEARAEIEVWRDHYNHIRPHSALNYLPIVEDAQRAG
ncbi:hypothetical protein HMEPL2_29130 [Vreelandella aquamarina]|jgi:transposase InsO family protein|uniref:Integrase catalytic domain-containing protein n=1 Tax=Vreelandella aquamarina TaxID=77097 RepID=A0A6F8XEE9_9GAMM|nr:hypothetical protein HMEPL2_29130 [Halomonas meridiana]